MRSLVAPLFIADARTVSTLTLVQALDTPLTVDISMFDLNGASLADFSKSLPAHSQTRILLNDYVKAASSGGYTIGSVIVAPTTAVDLGAQLSITRADPVSPLDIEEELVALNRGAGKSVGAVGMGISRSLVLALTNVGQSSQNVSLPDGQPATERRLSVSPQSTKLVRACGAEDDAVTANPIDPEEAASAEQGVPATTATAVVSDGEPGTLAVFGVISRSRSVSEAVPFVNLDNVQSSDETVYPGIAVGTTQVFGSKQFSQEFAIANVGKQPSTVHISYLSQALGGASKSEVASLTLAANTVKTVSLSRLAGDPAMQNSFVVTANGGDGKVVSSLQSISLDGAISIQTAGQDYSKTTNGGQHPLSSDGSTESLLLLSNPDSVQRSIGVTIYRAGKMESRKLSLGAQETRSINFGRERHRTTEESSRGSHLNPRLYSDALSKSTHTLTPPTVSRAP